jgi:hypothetical protein
MTKGMKKLIKVCICTFLNSFKLKQCNIPHRTSTGLSVTQFLTIKSAGLNYTEGPGKNITTLKRITGQLSPAVTQPLTPTVVMC